MAASRTSVFISSIILKMISDSHSLQIAMLSHAHCLHTLHRQVQRPGNSGKISPRCNRSKDFDGLGAQNLIAQCHDNIPHCIALEIRKHLDERSTLSLSEINCIRIASNLDIMKTSKRSGDACHVVLNYGTYGRMFLASIMQSSPMQLSRKRHFLGSVRCFILAEKCQGTLVGTWQR